MSLDQLCVFQDQLVSLIDAVGHKEKGPALTLGWDLCSPLYAVSEPTAADWFTMGTRDGDQKIFNYKPPLVQGLLGLCSPLVHFFPPHYVSPVF